MVRTVHCTQDRLETTTSVIRSAITKFVNRASNTGQCDCHNYKRKPMYKKCEVPTFHSFIYMKLNCNFVILTPKLKESKSSDKVEVKKLKNEFYACGSL